ncbi:hypothetical protein BHE74_00049727 [Ensete ventricosum]|uniref:Uncharacterized protein n=1 Tax=Ensete ventricosum TaxID=4639 RepID=A0A444G8Z4_ENSVE|nr:hypothetical protein B296_00058863 [Ensete ventricosum]RWW31350.1 hypothetical protein GW17_00004027 [Ensete ventricosum]RWW44532.1 hypothetical protein BHE74_00049727 [Ensete ventricosum]RZR82991.1 hypothetical protein BHM03_00009533 [Ensete ventricosum]
MLLFFEVVFHHDDAEENLPGDEQEIQHDGEERNQVGVWESQLFYLQEEIVSVLAMVAFAVEKLIDRIRTRR